MIKVNDEIINIEHFPDGTQKLSVECMWKSSGSYLIDWKYEKEEELSTLIYVTRHLKNNPWTKGVRLKINYLPNARMDRIHEEQEVFTLKSFADVINWLEFDMVRILDVHSNVGAALINNAIIETPQIYIDELIKKIEKEDMDIGFSKVIQDRDSLTSTVKDLAGNVTLVQQANANLNVNVSSLSNELILYFPDEGAAKRYSNMFPKYKYCYGEKRRDWSSGEILGLNIITNGINLKNKIVLMIDDIVAYGGSLFYSANELKNNGVRKIYAFATHTENSILDREKGTLIKSLENNTVERLFTTDSLFTGEHEKITVMEV